MTVEVPLIPQEFGQVPTGHITIVVPKVLLPKLPKSAMALMLVEGRPIGTLVKVLARKESGVPDDLQALAVQTLSLAEVRALLPDGLARVEQCPEAVPAEADEQAWQTLKRKAATLQRYLEPFHRRHLSRLLKGASLEKLDEFADWLCNRAYDFDDDGKPCDPLVTQHYLELPGIAERLDYLARILVTARRLFREERDQRNLDDQQPDEWACARALEYCPVDSRVLWKWELAECQTGVLPAAQARSNPGVWEHLVVVSCLAPGVVCALESATGTLVWQRRLGTLGGKPPCVTSRLVLVTDSSTLYALLPDSGRPVWTFRPLAGSGEGMYSSPAVAGDRLFIGDRRGFLHCLELDTGRLIWSMPTSDDQNSLNSAPLLYSELVIVANNDGLLRAYTQEDGIPVWDLRLDDAYGGRALSWFEGSVVAVTGPSVYLVDPQTGCLRQRWSDSPWTAALHCVAGERLLVVWDGPDERRELVAYQGRAELYRVEAARFVSKLVWDEASGLVIELRIDGAAVLNPENGQRVLGFLPKGALAQAAHPATHDGNYYFWTSAGYLWALRGPLFTNPG